jgi:hypothetical protein
MIRRAWSGLAIVGVLATSLVGCATHQAAVRDPETIAPSDLYPFRAGNAWSYDVDTGEPTTTLALTRVERIDGHRAHVRTGDALVVYEVQPEGIFVPDDGVWLLRAPIRVGTSWRARGDRNAEIVSTTAEAQTTAGSFEGCVEVLERGGPLGLEVRTVYCPGVGPATVTSTFHSELGDRALVVSARLRGYQLAKSPPTVPQEPRPR